MIPPAIAQHPIVRAVSLALVIGGMAVAVLRWFTPGGGPRPRRWYD